MKKILVLLIILLSMFGCEANQESINYDEIYIIAFESFISLDEGLNSEMEYIAINNETLVDATLSEIKIVTDYFKKYEVDVINESYKTLDEKGMVNEGIYIDGILLEIEVVDLVSKNKIIVEGSKYRSGLGAIGVKCIIVKEDGNWILESADITWIS